MARSSTRGKSKRRTSEPAEPVVYSPADILTPEAMADPATVAAVQRGMDSATKAAGNLDMNGRRVLVGSIINVNNGEEIGMVRVVHDGGMIYHRIDEEHQHCFGWQCGDCAVVYDSLPGATHSPSPAETAAGSDPKQTLLSLITMAVTIEDRFCRFIGETSDELTAPYAKHFDAAVTERVKVSLAAIDASFADLLRACVGQDVLDAESPEQAGKAVAA